MKQKTLKLLEEAISSAGRWTWMELSENSVQLEFEDIQLYRPTLEKYDKHSSEIAIRLADNPFFSVFYDNYEDIESFNNVEKDFSYKIAEEGLKFQDFDVFKRISNDYSHEINNIGISSKDVDIVEFDFLLTIVFENFAIGCGGNQLNFFNDFESLNDEDIKKLSNQWCIYWMDYWKSKNTENQYEYDPACEYAPFYSSGAVIS